MGSNQPDDIKNPACSMLWPGHVHSAIWLDMGCCVFLEAVVINSFGAHLTMWTRWTAGHAAPLHLIPASNPHKPNTVQGGLEPYFLVQRSYSCIQIKRKYNILTFRISLYDRILSYGWSTPKLADWTHKNKTATVLICQRLAVGRSRRPTLCPLSKYFLSSCCTHPFSVQH